MKRVSLHKKKKTSSLKRKFFAGLFFCLLAALIYFLVFSPILWIENIELTENGTYYSAKEIKDIINTHLENKLFYFIPQKSIFLVPNNRIENDILEKYPEIRTIKINKELPNLLKIEIKERESIGLWCQTEELTINEEETKIVEHCFYIDSQGIIFRKAPSMSGSLVLKIYDLKNQTAEIRKEVVSKDNINFILKAKEELLKTLDLKILGFEDISIEEIRAKTSQGWQIYFNPNYSIDSQIESLKVVLEEEIKDKTIEYIDLRIEGRVYYK